MLKKIVTWYRTQNRPRKLLFWFATLTALYTLIGFLLAPPIVRLVLEKKLPEVLQRPVSIETIRLNPYTLSATVEGFRVARKDGEGQLLGFERFYANLESVSLFKKALVVSSLVLDAPEVDISRLDETRFNFSDLLAGSGQEPAAKDEPGGQFHFSVNNIELHRGRIAYRDLPKGVDHRVEKLEVGIASISNLPAMVEIRVQPHFSAVVNGAPFDLGGTSKPFADSLETELNLKMDGIDVPQYLSYIPNPTGLTLKSARLDVDTRITFLREGGVPSSLTVTGNLRLRELDVTDRQQRSYLNLPELSVRLAGGNLLHKEVNLAEVKIDAPQLRLERNADGSILPLALLETGAGRDEPESAAATGDEENADGSPLKLNIEKVLLEKGGVRFDDRLPQTPVLTSIGDVRIAVEHFSTLPETPAALELGLKINQSGTFSSRGELVLQPFSLKTGLELKSLRLADFQSYLSELARVRLSGGDLTIEGDAVYAQQTGGDAEIGFKGGASLAGLASEDSISGADLVKWNDLALRQIDFAMRPAQPPRLSIAEIRLAEPFAQLLVRDDGSVNLATLVKESPQPVGTEAQPAADPATGTAAGGPEPLIEVAKVVIEQGRFKFNDRSIDPVYATSLEGLDGSISGLSSQQGQLARVDLHARVDRQAPLAITGTLNPLSAEPEADITIDFKNFNLSPASPYSGRYIGNKIAKGKLNLDLDYHLKDHRLESSNKAFLDQFTLGETVDSPDATGLPVGLAIALLQDRKGEIHLDIPVAGDLDDPEFSVGGVVLQVLVNLIAKAATSPFALLGALIPAGEDIQFIPFESGLSLPGDEALGKLELVAKVLEERPGLKMEIVGHIDREQDGAVLARRQMLQLVRLEKAGKGQPAAGPVEAIAADPDYPSYLERVYRKALEKAPKERREEIAKQGAAANKEQPPPKPEERLARMEAFLLEGIRVGDEDLRLLAIERANAVLANLVEVGKVAPGRLFVVEPKLDAGEGKAVAELVIK